MPPLRLLCTRQTPHFLLFWRSLQAFLPAQKASGNSMMNCISHISSAAVFSQRSSLYGISSTAWRGIRHSGIRLIKFDYISARLHVQSYSTRRARSSLLPKLNPQPLVEEESDSFYVVRKGDIIGIYKSLSDCQAQVSSSVCDPPVSVYKGYSLRKETKDYLASQGLKDALYSINAVDVKGDLFGTLLPCPFKQPDGASFLVDRSPEKTTTQNNSVDMLNSLSSCTIEFDGASKGNPGKAGAGAILRTEDGLVISRLREGLGVATNNVAEYRALIMGMKEALKKGFSKIYVQGDSKLVCMQVNDLWRTKNQNMVDLCKEAKELKDKFLSFKISHVKREFNSDADAQANFAIDLPPGEIYEECSKPC